MRSVALVVEREFLIALDIERIIEENFECEVIVSTPLTAIDELQKSQFDSVILDADLGEVDLRRIIALVDKPNEKLVLTTLSNEIISDMAHLPHAAILLKPFTDQQIIEALARVFKKQMDQRA